MLSPDIAGGTIIVRPFAVLIRRQGKVKKDPGVCADET
jgi:hypothetical protein